MAIMAIMGKLFIDSKNEGHHDIDSHCRFRLLLLGDDSVNGSKTQSTVTTESNTPDNTLRLDSLAQKVGVNYTIEDGEVIIESKTNFTKRKHSAIHFHTIYFTHLILEGIRESEVVKQTIAMANLDSYNEEYAVTLMQNLKICIKFGNCEIENKHFK